MVDWEKVRGEVTDLLQSLLRLNTTNPPGNEIEAARLIADVLSRDGYAPRITESEPGRGNVTARLEGGQEAPLLLLSHTDVVAADAGKWSHSPFGGEVRDGYVWGRGALDMKNMVAAELMVMLLLKRLEVKLDRHLLFAATADEEAGKGNHGVGWLLDNQPEQLEAAYVITEGGGADLRVGGAHYFTCQTGQKGICRMRLDFEGRPGHASIPHDENAVVRLCRSLAGLHEAQFPLHPSSTVTAFVEGVAAQQDEPTGQLLRQVLDPAQSNQALNRLPLTDDLKAELRSVLRNTASATMLQAGTNINVIPAEAAAWIDGRLAPGQTQESFIEELRTFIGHDARIEVDQYSPSLEASTDTELYRTITTIMRQHMPNAHLVPCISTGGTDAKHLCPRRPHVQVYGFMPYRQAPARRRCS